MNMQGHEGVESNRIVVRVDSDLEELIPGFLESMQARSQRIRRALADGDFDAVRAVGHDMKGSGAGYGFDAITDMGASLERAASAGDSASMSHQLELLANYLGRVDVVFE